VITIAGGRRPCPCEIVSEDAAVGLPLVLPLPVDTDEVTVFVEMHVELAMEGSLHRLADPSRKMDVGGVDRNAIGDILDGHDAVQRMFLFLDLFLMMDNCHDLGPLLLNHGSCEGHDTGRIPVIDPMAGLA
jgi:hypothetical protein